MKVGDLVKITRGGVGCPRGTIGMVLAKKRNHADLEYFSVWLCRAKNSTVTRLGFDLEVINEGR
jgi:hypothetical protein